MSKNKFDCIVIGGGHAGIEAAHAAAKMGCKTALVTILKNKIGAMSCNPAIGGLAKGQIVCEVDALGGLMGLATDATGIQFRLLNRSKGPAVQSPRAQADKHKYARWMQKILEQTANLTIIENMVSDIIVHEGKIDGIICKDGSEYKSQAVVVATGTFLRGLMHIGEEQFRGGRIEEPASDELADALERIGLELGRLKTGTPPRIDPKTVDYDKLETQPGDDEPVPFSFLTKKIECRQVPCWITYTNEKIHQLIKDNLHRAPLYSGQIKSVGPRYCPSLEVKIVRFPDKTRHQIFLEPEDEENTTIYCNGISTSVPRDIQEKILQLMPGTEKARIIRYGYAIEYDYCPPTQLKNNLETRKIEGLFLAGQINGTSGYEEAAGQGIMAGINAALKIQGKEPLILSRDQGYIGVMIDDLLTKGIDEPYRMFTSRAEFRLTLRADNADRRLTQIGRSVGVVDETRWQEHQRKIRLVEELKNYLMNTRRDGMNLWGQLRQTNNNLAERIGDEPEIKNNPQFNEVLKTVLTDAKYEGYLVKEQRLAESLRNMEKQKIPMDLDYESIAHLRAEAKQKLAKFHPLNLAQASRISGVTPADITVIQIHLKKYY